jgi:hypothetical protein
MKAMVAMMLVAMPATMLVAVTTHAGAQALGGCNAAALLLMDAAAKPVRLRLDSSVLTHLIAVESKLQQT